MFEKLQRPLIEKKKSNYNCENIHINQKTLPTNSEIIKSGKKDFEEFHNLFEDKLDKMSLKGFYSVFTGMNPERGGHSSRLLEFKDNNLQKDIVKFLESRKYWIIEATGSVMNPLAVQKVIENAPSNLFPHKLKHAGLKNIKSWLEKNIKKWNPRYQGKKDDKIQTIYGMLSGFPHYSSSIYNKYWRTYRAHFPKFIAKHIEDKSIIHTILNREADQKTRELEFKKIDLTKYTKEEIKILKLMLSARMFNWESGLGFIAFSEKDIVWARALEKLVKQSHLCQKVKV